MRPASALLALGAATVAACSAIIDLSDVRPSDAMGDASPDAVVDGFGGEGATDAGSGSDVSDAQADSSLLFENFDEDSGAWGLFWHQGGVGATVTVSTDDYHLSPPASLRIDARAVTVQRLALSRLPSRFGCCSHRGCRARRPA